MALPASKEPISDLALRDAVPEDALCLSVLAMQVFLDTYATDGIRPELAREVLTTYSQAAFGEAIAHERSCILVAERGEECVREFGCVERLLRQGRDGFLNFNGVHCVSGSMLRGGDTTSDAGWSDELSCFNPRGTRDFVTWTSPRICLIASQPAAYTADEMNVLPVPFSVSAFVSISSVVVRRSWPAQRR